MKTYTCIVGTHKKHLSEVLLMSTHNMFSWRSNKNITLLAPFIWSYDFSKNKEPFSTAGLWVPATILEVQILTGWKENHIKTYKNTPVSMALNNT